MDDLLSKDRLNPFADDEPLPGLDKFKPKTADQLSVRPQASQIEQAAAEQGFPERGPKSKPTPRRRREPPKREGYRTGRSHQFNMKVRAEDIARFDAQCERQGWVKGQTLEYALDALEALLEDPNSEFWRMRGIIPKSQK